MGVTPLFKPKSKYSQRNAPLQTLFPGKMGDADFDKYLRVESQQFNQENEVKRVLNLMQNGNKDPLMVLEYPTDIYVTLRVDEKSLKKQFRLKSLLLHPDKNPHPEARVAFDELQRALKEIQDHEKFSTVKRYIKDARDNIFFLQGIKVPKADDGGRENVNFDELIKNHPKLGRLVQLEFVRMVQELAYRDKTRLKNEQGRELEASERIEKELKKKREFEKEWEKTREERIGSWRKFAEKGVKKRRKKSPLPGALPPSLRK